MRFNIFVKAEKLKDKVFIQGTTSDRAWFSFKELDDPPLIELAVEQGKYTYLVSCSCTSCSIHLGTAYLIGKHPLCSYQLAVLKSLPFEKGELFHEKER